MLPVYNLITSAGGAIAVPAMRLKAAAFPASRERVRQRLGEVPQCAPRSGSPGRDATLWLQAVSVGEVRTAETFLKSLRAAYPALQVALSATTKAGAATAARLEKINGPGSGLAEKVFVFPLDVPWVVRRALDRLRPDVYGSVETEIWPGLLDACAARAIPAILVNGSISSRSERRLAWLGGSLRKALRGLRAACVQTSEDAERLGRLGVPHEALVVTGNMKYDGAKKDLGEAASVLARALGIEPGRPLLVAGSTAHGEESIVLDAWRTIASEIPEALLVVAPRQPDRFEAVARLLRSAQLPLARRSAGETLPAGRGGVILLDTLGDLEAAYGLASAAFVGGSLVPRGGQNPIEPARLGVPVLFGPGMDNFRDVAGDLLSSGGAVQVATSSELAARALAWMANPRERSRAGAAARRLVDSHAGATRKTLEALHRLLPGTFI